MRPSCDGQIWASQGGLSRNKVAVEESAAGSPPTERDQADAPDPPLQSEAVLGPMGSQDLSELDLPFGRSGAIPDGSVRRIALEPLPLIVGRRSDVIRKTSALLRASVGRKGRCTDRVAPAVLMTPRVRAIQASTGLVQFHRVTTKFDVGYCAAWWIARLGSR